MLGSVCCALLIPALVLGGGAHHSHAEAVAMGIHGADHGAGDAHELAQAHKDSGTRHDGSEHAANERDHDHAAPRSCTGSARAHRHAVSPAHPSTQATSTPEASQTEKRPRTTAAGIKRNTKASSTTSASPGTARTKTITPGDTATANTKADNGGGGSDGEQPITISYEPSPRTF